MLGLARQGILDRYGARLSVSTSAGIVTLLEGSTPLVPAPRLANAIAPGADLLLKCEGANPTGSFKDRGMTAAITQAAADGATSVICASTGNTAASAAAYAARAGMRCTVVVPDGGVALGKLAGALAYGAHVVAIRGSFDVGLRVVREVAERSSVVLVNSLNPARIEGQMTASFEICEDLGEAPDWLCLPVGNAGNITSYWAGFRSSVERGDCARLPRILGAQAAGAAPIVLGHPVEEPRTVASAIRIGNPARWAEARSALDQSRGQIVAVSDEEILAAYRQVSRLEGVFCEPSSAAGLAGLARCVRDGALDPRGQRIVAVLTGHGLKDPDAAVSDIGRTEPIDPSPEALLELVHA